MPRKNRRTDSDARRTRRVQELRQSNATTAVPSGKAYKRAKAGSRNRDW